MENVTVEKVTYNSFELMKISFLYQENMITRYIKSEDFKGIIDYLYNSMSGLIGGFLDTTATYAEKKGGLLIFKTIAAGALGLQAVRKVTGFF